VERRLRHRGIQYGARRLREEIGAGGYQLNSKKETIMTSETAVRSNTEIIREYTRRIFNEHNPDLASEYLAPEMKWPGGLLGTIETAI
jgi:hypothetical protein